MAISVKIRRVGFGASSVLLAVLIAPSIWMLTAIPPLWRDVDAYVQLTRPPGFETILRYGPLYCFIARIPLYFGFAIDCLKTGAPLPNASFFVHPTLTDSGVLALLVSQHFALALATFYLVTAATRAFWVRLMLVVMWAANPLFYTFAHCVGSETLSMVLTILIGATGLRIARHSHNVLKTEWLVLGALLSLSILTRHINAVLAGLLPLTLLLLGGYRLVSIAFARDQLLRRWNWLRARRTGQIVAAAFVMGLLCVFFADGVSRSLCYAARTPYNSAFGVTFLFRLKFLAGLSAQNRDQLLDDVSRKSDSPDVKEVISLLKRELQTGSSSLDVGTLTKELEASIAQSQTPVSVDAALNYTAWAFLCPPRPVFLHAVTSDFRQSLETTIPDVVRFLFVTTTFYFSHSAAMPQLAPLVTFRDKTTEQIFALFKHHSYFHHPNGLSQRALLFCWIIGSVLLAIVAKKRKKNFAEVACYAVALIVTGLLLMAANCFLTIFQPRFTLPMWELTIISVTILLGAMMDCLVLPPPPFLETDLERKRIKRQGSNLDRLT